MDKFVAHVMEQHDLAEIDTLQYIFWSAQELKIHFRVDGKNITPFETKQILLQSPEKYVEIITNKNVENSIFQDVTLFYQKLSTGKNQNTFDDQYSFSRSLLLDLKKWETNLNSFKSIAQKPFYPGKTKIHEYLQILKMVQNHNDLIVQKKTKAHQIRAISKIDVMIKELIKLFDIYTPDLDKRKKFLYALRSARKKNSAYYKHQTNCLGFM